MANIRKKVKKSISKKPKTENIKMSSVKNTAPKPKKIKKNTGAEIIKMAPTQKVSVPKVKKSSQSVNNSGKIYGLKLLKTSKALLRQKHFVTALICVFLVAVVLILSFSTATGLPEYITNSFASIKAGNGFPTQPEGGKIIYSNISKNNVFSLTDTNFIGFNKNGSEILSVQHGYDNPAAVTDEARSLIYNYKNKKYTVANYSSVLTSGEVENDIILGTICKNGSFAFSTKSTGFAGQVDVFNKKAKKVFSWFSASDPISNIALSDNGKRLAVVTVSASGGYIKSTVSCLKFNSATPIFKYELNGAVLDIETYSNGFLVVLTEKIVYYNWSRGEILAKDFGSDKVMFAKIKENGQNIIVCQKGIITNSYSIKFNKKQKEKFTIDYNGAISDIDFHNNQIYILSNRKITVLNSKSEVVKTYDLANKANAILVSKNGNIYTYNDSGVFKID